MGRGLTGEECPECLLDVLLPEEAELGELGAEGLGLPGVGLQVGRHLRQGTAHSGVRIHQVLVALLVGVYVWK